MAEFFQAELPDQSSKLPFTKRLSHKFTRQKGKRKQSKTASSSVTPPAISYINVASPGSCAQESHVTGHVRTRRITSQPAPRMLLRARPETSQSNLVRAGRNFSIISLAFPEPHIEYPISSHASSYDSAPVEEQGDIPRLHRKEAPQLTVRDALVEQFDKLRIPAKSTHARLAPVQVPACPSPTNFSFPLQSSNSTKAAKLAWNRMAISNPILPSFREQPHSHTNQLHANHHRQIQISTEPIVIDNDSENDATVGPNRPAGNFENTNFFQSGGLSRQSLNRRRPRRDRFLRKTPDRRNQSPSASGISSEGNLTLRGSENSASDLSARVAQVGRNDSIQATTRTRGLVALHVSPDRNAQEEQDRLLAQHLQRQEDDMYTMNPAQLAERARLAAPQTASPEILPQRSEELGSLRRAITDIGTRENPIDLDSNSDDPETAIPERVRIQDYVALYGEPMEIDGVSPFDAPRTVNACTDERTHLQSRDCVVCGDSIHVVDLPSLANCDHRPETCADCYSGWITAQLQGSSWRQVKCPGNKCKVVLSYHEIRLYAETEAFQQYDTFIARAAFSEDPNFRWCRACDSGQIHLSGVEGNIFTCVACRHKVCIIHENTWHEGETCDDFEYRSSGRKEREQKAQEEASLKAIGKLTKKCPGPGCSWNIEKNHGCDHMTCSKCRHEFCWSCLCNYSKIRRVGNSAHATTCKYHTGRLA